MAYEKNWPIKKPIHWEISSLGMVILIHSLPAVGMCIGKYQVFQYHHCCQGISGNTPLKCKFAGRAQLMSSDSCANCICGNQTAASRTKRLNQTAVHKNAVHQYMLHQNAVHQTMVHQNAVH